MEFNGQPLLAGGTAIEIANVGANIDIDSGIVAIKFGNDHDVATTWKTYELSYNATMDKFTISRGSTNQLSAAVSTAPATGQTKDVYFSIFDLTITLASNWDAGTSVTTSNTFEAVAAKANTISYSFKVGTGNAETADVITVTLDKAGSTILGKADGIPALSATSLTTKANADTASKSTTDAINDVNNYRGKIGVSQNRLEFAATNLATTIENSEAARSALLDLDVASEMSAFTSRRILVQAGVSMLAQANLLPRNLLRLFQ